jgi:hypothetical protein
MVINRLSLQAPKLGLFQQTGMMLPINLKHMAPAILALQIRAVQAAVAVAVDHIKALPISRSSYIL